jgi:hypothetical protein
MGLSRLESGRFRRELSSHLFKPRWKKCVHPSHLRRSFPWRARFRMAARRGGILGRISSDFREVVRKSGGSVGKGERLARLSHDKLPSAGEKRYAFISQKIFTPPNRGLTMPRSPFFRDP